mgnify:FL=1
MAIYHCSTKTVNRSSGRSSVAAAAYRAGDEIKDQRTGLNHDFTRKEGVAYSEIISNLDIEIKRAELWNLAEEKENRKDARTAREWVIALPDELNPEQRTHLAKDFAQSLVDRYNVVADLAIHEPSKGGSDKNHHAHILLTTRQAQLDQDHQLTLTTKTAIELSNTKRKALGMTTSQEEIKEIRAAWADLANKALEQAGYQDRIDHRSYVDQGKDLQPTIHEGSKVTQLRRQGIETEISRFNDEIKRQNEKRLNPSIQPREQALASGLNRVEDRFEQWKKDQEAKKLAQDRQLKLQQDQEKQARLAKQQENKTKSRGLEK